MKKKNAFTLIELLVVIGILAILAALILPGLSQAKQRAKAIQCTSNIKQMNIAWQSYAYDNEGKLVINTPITPDVNLGAGKIGVDWRWIKGYMFYGRENWLDNVHRDFLRNNRLSSYLNGEDKLYLCPSDTTKVLVAGKKQRWVRSIALNKWMSDSPRYPGTKESIHLRANYRIFGDVSDIDVPSERYTFLNSRRDTIDNGFFENGHENLFNPLRFKWYEHPARYHSNSTAIGFSDGHVEMHRWRTEWPVGNMYDIVQQINGTLAPNNPDIEWLNMRSTTLKGTSGN